MAENYSFAEKKRIRKSFEKISSVMSLPDILEVQTNSYKHFLQSAVNKDKRLDQLDDEFKVYSCRTIMNCSKACPKGLSPAKAIAGIKKELASRK